MELKRHNKLMNINDQVELAQFECDCAMMVYRRRTKKEAEAKTGEESTKRKDGRMDTVEISMEELRRSVDMVKSKQEEGGGEKLEEIHLENRKLKGKVNELKDAVDEMKLVIDEMNNLLRGKMNSVSGDVIKS